jgi:hypothetical protein
MEEKKPVKKLVFAKTTYDVQRLKLEKMMQNPVSFRLTFDFQPLDCFDLKP